MPKRTREDDDDDVSTLTEMPAKRPRPTIVQLNKVDTQNNIEDQLKSLGSNIDLIANKAAEMDQVSDADFQRIQSQLNDIFKEVFEQAKMKVREQRMAETAAMAAEEEKVQQARALRLDFIEDVKRITDRMTSELTVGQQAYMFKYIISEMNKGLDNAYQIAQPEEPNQMARLSEISSYMCSQLSVTLTNIYNVTPQVATQTVAIIAASGMLYNYLPSSVRGSLASLPYFGSAFMFMNRTQDQMALIKNSAVTVTTIYYLLKNAGIDTLPAIQGLGAMATSSASTATASAFSALQTGASNVLNIITDKLGQLITSEYHKENLMGDSEMSQRSISSRSSANTVDISEFSRNSQISQMSVESLFDMPLQRGGINLPEAFNNPTIIEERLNAIVNAEQGTNPIIEGHTIENVAVATEIPVADTAMVIAEPEGYYNDSQDSGISRASSMSGLSSMTDTTPGATFPMWFFGEATRGGRRMRRSRRHMKLRKTRKGRKGRKGRITKKAKRHHKTMKRYRGKMRR